MKKKAKKTEAQTYEIFLPEQLTSFYVVGLGPTS